MIKRYYKCAKGKTLCMRPGCAIYFNKDGKPYDRYGSYRELVPVCFGCLNRIRKHLSKTQKRSVKCKAASLGKRAQASARD